MEMILSLKLYLIYVIVFFFPFYENKYILKIKLKYLILFET